MAYFLFDASPFKHGDSMVISIALPFKDVHWDGDFNEHVKSPDVKSPEGILRRPGNTSLHHQILPTNLKRMLGLDHLFFFGLKHRLSSVPSPGFSDAFWGLCFSVNRVWGIIINHELAISMESHYKVFEVVWNIKQHQ